MRTTAIFISLFGFLLLACSPVKCNLTNDADVDADEDGDGYSIAEGGCYGKHVRTIFDWHSHPSDRTGPLLWRWIKIERPWDQRYDQLLRLVVVGASSEVPPPSAHGRAGGYVRGVVVRARPEAERDVTGWSQT